MNNRFYCILIDRTSINLIGNACEIQNYYEFIHKNNSDLIGNCNLIFYSSEIFLLKQRLSLFSILFGFENTLIVC